MSYVDSRTFNVLSICSGVGGLELGVRLAVSNARTVCYVEREAYCCEILVSRMQDKALDEAPVWTDLKTFDGRAWRGAVDCVVGGYPCQPFSVAGQKRGTDDPRYLWPYVADIVRQCRPGYCFFENVANHLNLGFYEVAGELLEMGYRVAAGLFTAAEVGAPHLRKRVFILAHANSKRKSQQQGGEPDERGRPGDDSLPLDDTEEQCRQIRPTEGGRPGRSASECRGPQAHGISDGLEGQQPPRTAAGATGRGSGAEVSLFPPGPGEIELWRYVLEINPSLEPAVCRVADGLADRVDRLRACGNGVVPLVAAYAFRTLYSDLFGETE